MFVCFLCFCLRTGSYSNWCVMSYLRYTYLWLHLKYSLKILCKSIHFPGRYKTKCEWVFFFWTQYMCVCVVMEPVSMKRCACCCCCSWCMNGSVVSNGDNVGTGRSWSSSLWHVMFERLLCVPVVSLQLLRPFQLPLSRWDATTTTTVSISNGGVHVGKSATDGPWDVGWAGVQQTSVNDTSVWWL